jgi:hypothetical protein
MDEPEVLYAVDENIATRHRVRGRLPRRIAQIKEFDLNLRFRRAAAATMKLGTAFEHRQRIARHLVEERS